MTEQLLVVNAYLSDDERDVVLLHRRSDGVLERRTVPAEWASFVAKDALSSDQLRAIQSNWRVLGVLDDGAYWRIRWKTREARYEVHGDTGPFRHWGVPTFEADVHPVRRLFADRSDLVVQRPVRSYLDFETDSRVPFSRKEEARVLSWSLIDEIGDGAVGVLDEDADRCEEEMLHQLVEELERYDQVVAWNGNAFDFPVFEARLTYLLGKKRARAALRRLLLLDHMLVYEKQNRMSAESGDEKTSLKLNDVASSVLKEGKDEFDASKTFQEWAKGGEAREVLVRYMVKDTLLMQRIEQRTGYLALFDTAAEVTNCFPETRSLQSTVQLDGYMLRRGAQAGKRFPTKVYGRGSEEQYAGAYVMEPTFDGLTRDVQVADFSGMYPGIIVTFNMSPETKARVPVNGPIPAGYCRSPATGVGFETGKEGMLAGAVKEMIRLRKTWNDKKGDLPAGTEEWKNADRRSTAYKVIANSFYGVVGSPFSRFFDAQIAESVTLTGKWLIEMTIDEAAKRSMIARYADTDSLFVADAPRDQFAEFVKWCNEDLYPPALKACGCTENLVKLAYEKELRVIVMAGKKRYAAAYTHYKWNTTCPACSEREGKAAGSVSVKTLTCKECKAVYTELPRHQGEPEIKGFEYRRGDSARLARELQETVIKLVLDKMEESIVPVCEVLEAMRARVFAEEGLPLENVRITKALKKPLKDYASKKKADGTDAAQPPHVAVAKILLARGEEVGEGTRIGYVVIDAGCSPQRVIPASDYIGEFDRHDLWNEKIFEPSKRVLEAAFPHENWGRFAVPRPRKARGKGQEQTGDLFAPKPFEGRLACAMPRKTSAA